MKFPAKGSVDFEIAPAGNHVAICNGVVDLGWQPGSGMYPAPKHQVYLRFELPNEVVTFNRDGKDVTGPMSIGRRFTASMSGKANLRKFIESWFGRAFSSDDAAADFDLAKLLGYKCLLNVTHSDKGDKTYANVKDATPIPKGMAADVKQQNKSLFFDLDERDEEAYRQLPEWLRKVIDSRLPPPEAPKTPPTQEQVAAVADFDDDIPF